MKMLRVRRDHTCISLELFKNDERDLCDKCYLFRQRQKGMGRKLRKGDIPKCEKPWFYDTNGKVYNNLLIKKKRYIELLHKYNYKVINDDCGRDK